MGNKASNFRIKSHNSFTKNLALMIIAGIGSFIGCYFLLVEYVFEVPYPQLVGLIGAGVAFVFGTVAFASIYWLEPLAIFEDRLEVRSLFGNLKQIIYFTDITSWTQIKKSNKSGKWKELILYTRHSSYKINSSNYKNYKAMREILTEGKPRDAHKEEAWHTKKALQLALFFCIAGGFFLYLAYEEAEKQPMSTTEVQTVTGVLANDPEIVRKRRSKEIRIKFQSQPEYIFRISGVAYRVTYDIQDLKAGDTISVVVSIDQYQKKITKEKELTSWDKMYAYKWIPVYGLEDKQSYYLQFGEYNNERMESAKEDSWMIGIFGAALLGLGLYLIAMMQTEKNRNGRRI